MTQTRRDGRHFLIELRRTDINIKAINPFDDAREFSIFLYPNGDEILPPAHIDAVIAGLTAVIAEIAGAEIGNIKR